MSRFLSAFAITFVLFSTACAGENETLPLDPYVPPDVEPAACTPNLDGAITSRLPLDCMLDTSPARSICSIRRAARL